MAFMKELNWSGIVQKKQFCTIYHSIRCKFIYFADIFFQRKNNNLDKIPAGGVECSYTYLVRQWSKGVQECPFIVQTPLQSSAASQFFHTSIQEEPQLMAL